LEQLAGGAKFADVERAIATSAEAEKRASDAAKLAAAPTKAVKNTQAFSEEHRNASFADLFGSNKPQKVTAATVERILKDQLGIKNEGEYVPESVNPDGTIKYRFEGTIGKVPSAAVQSIYASLPATFTSYGELADQIAYLQANPEKQLAGTPASITQGYSGSLALAKRASPTGELTRDEMRAIAGPYYGMTTDAKGNRGRTMEELIYLKPGSDYNQQIRGTAADDLRRLTNTGTGTGTGITTGTGTGITTGTGTGITTGTGTVTPPRITYPGTGTTTPSITYPSTGTTTPGTGFIPSTFVPKPVTTFDGVYGSAMPYNPTPFVMPKRDTPITWGDINTPIHNPFDTMYKTPYAYNPYNDTTSTQSPFTYPTQTASGPMPQYNNPYGPMPQYNNPFEPAMFAEGGEVNQSGFMEVGTPGFMSQAMAGQMPTYQYPAYGGMPQDVFNWTAPYVSNGQLVQPPRQNPVIFEAPNFGGNIGTGGGTTNTVIGGTGNDIFAPTPITPVNTVTGGTGNDIITTLPVDYTPAITQAYSDILGRTPDAAGLSYWSNLANQGVSMDDIRRDIQLNENQLISQAYKDILGRDEVDAPGLAYWANSGQDMDTIRRNIQLNKEQQGIAALPVAQGPTTTTPVAETAPVVAPVVEPPPPRQYFQTTNYESGEGYMVDLPTPMAGFEADSSGGSWYNSGDSSGAVGANAGAEAAAAAADAAAAAANNDGPGDGVGSAGNDSGAAGQGEGTGAEGPGTE
jgi:hypothetical protein